jgi:hypothetical protein
VGNPNARRNVHFNNSKRYWKADRQLLEYNLLLAADEALGGLGNGSATPAAATATVAAAPARRARRSSGGGTGKRGRPKGSGTRAAQALQLVTDRPGITIPEMAEAMGIQQNYLYRVMPDLAEKGQVTKSGRGWHLRSGATT